MKNHPIWIVSKKLAFDDLIGKEDNYISGWKCVIDSWMLEPAYHMANNEKRVTDRGISMLMLLISFFEPIGAILSGESSDGSSKNSFIAGFKYFKHWLKDKGEECEIDEDLVYAFARCGLMHSFTMQGGQIFVDAFGVGKTSMGKYDYRMRHSKKKSGEPSNHEVIYLIDPWRLLPQIEDFCTDFCIRLEDSKASGTGLYSNFRRTFERTIVNPGIVYSS